MSKLRLNVTMSLDGYIAGPNQGVENPLGEGGATGTDDDIGPGVFSECRSNHRGSDLFSSDAQPWD
jgi:hypothetical protein